MRSGNGRNTRTLDWVVLTTMGAAYNDGWCLQRWVLPSAADWILATHSSVPVRRVIPRAKSRQPISAARAAPFAASRADSARSARKIVFYLARTVLVLLAMFFVLALNRQKGQEIARKRFQTRKTGCAPVCLRFREDTQELIGVDQKQHDHAANGKPDQRRDALPPGRRRLCFRRSDQRRAFQGGHFQ